MKAEHRKELQTNVLADHLGRMMTSLKSGSRSTALIFWISAAVLIALVVVIVVMKNRSERSRSALWTQLDVATSTGNLSDLEQVAEKNPGTVQARTAQFQRARLLLEQGLNLLGSEQRREEAIKNIDEARSLYASLVDQCRDAPLLQQEALMGQAKAEESLIGIPGEDSSPSGGTVERALELYQQLARDYPGSFQGKAAARRAEELSKNGEAIRRFYTELNQRYVKAKK
jgi:hypothetical protein